MDKRLHFYPISINIESYILEKMKKKLLTEVNGDI